MTPDLIRRAGEALFGPKWTTPFANALGVTPRTVRRWAAGQVEPKPGVWADLAALVNERKWVLMQIARELAALDLGVVLRQR